MAPATDTSGGKISAVSEFYDGLSVDYDEMTAFEGRFVRERPFAQLIVERYGIRSALDAGSGTGFHTLLLSDLGVRMTAVDVSGKMLAQLRRHARQRKLSIRTVRTSITELRGIARAGFDAVFCLGNTLAHLTSDEARHETLRSFRKVLKAAGTLIVQSLNFDRIMIERPRVVSIREVGSRSFVRFYNYDEGGVQFSIQTIDRREPESRASLRTIQLSPVLRKDLLRMLSHTGFSRAHTYGGMGLGAYDPKRSSDLVIIALAGATSGR